MKRSTALMVAGAISAPAIVAVTANAASDKVAANAGHAGTSAVDTHRTEEQRQLRLHIKSLTPSAGYVSEHDKNGHCAQA